MKISPNFAIFWTSICLRSSRTVITCLCECDAGAKFLNLQKVMAESFDLENPSWLNFRANLMLFLGNLRKLSLLSFAIVFCYLLNFNAEIN